METEVYVVRAKDPVTGKMLPVSAWVDPYHAKFEADRWEYDTKVPYDHVPGRLVLEDVPYAD